MRVLRKIIGLVAIALYVLVVLFLTINTWAEYADGLRSLPHAIWQSAILLGLPLLLAIGLALPELAVHTLARCLRKLFGKGNGVAP